MLQKVVPHTTDVAPSPHNDDFIAGEREFFTNWEHTVVLSANTHLRLPTDVQLTSTAADAQHYFTTHPEATMMDRPPVVVGPGTQSSRQCLACATPQAKLSEVLNGFVTGPHYFCIMLPEMEVNGLIGS